MTYSWARGSHTAVLALSNWKANPMTMKWMDDAPAPISYARFVAYKVGRHKHWLVNAKWCREHGRWRAHAENLRMAAIVRRSIGRAP
jgi:hypothetical protein